MAIVDYFNQQDRREVRLGGTLSRVCSQSSPVIAIQPQPLFAHVVPAQPASGARIGSGMQSIGVAIVTKFAKENDLDSNSCMKFCKAQSDQPARKNNQTRLARTQLTPQQHYP